MNFGREEQQGEGPATTAMGWHRRWQARKPPKVSVDAEEGL